MLDQLTSRKTLHDAFLRVQENGGCRGADGVTLGHFQANLETELDSLQDRLIRRRYHPFPLLRFQIPKREEGFRDLTVPAVRDRVLQTAVYHLTRETFEAEFEECSYAFREGRSVKGLSPRRPPPEAQPGEDPRSGLQVPGCHLPQGFDLSSL